MTSRQSKAKKIQQLRWIQSQKALLRERTTKERTSCHTQKSKGLCAGCPARNGDRPSGQAAGDVCIGVDAAIPNLRVSTQNLQDQNLMHVFVASSRPYRHRSKRTQRGATATHQPPQVDEAAHEEVRTADQKACHHRRGPSP